MPNLQQIIQGEIEKFDGTFFAIGRIEDNLRYDTKTVGYCEANLDTIKQFILSSHLTLLQGVLEMVEKEKRKKTTDSATVEEQAIEYGHNQALSDIITAIQEQITLIKNNQ